MKHSEIINKISSLLSKHELDSIKSFGKRTSSGHNYVVLYFNDQESIEKIVSKHIFEYSHVIQKRYGIGLAVGFLC